MIQVRKAGERGHFNHGWLDTFHTFSFAEYRDDRFMGFRSLRVINEDVVEAGAGFPTHSHRDMEIITYVLEGEVEHKDSMGNAGVIRPGEVQRMSAGTGVTHSEYNPSKKNPLHLLQIWIFPEKKGQTPSYEQKSFAGMKSGNFVLVASPKGEDGSVTVHQDVKLYAARLKKGEEALFGLDAGRHAWLQVARGAVMLNDKTALGTSDGAAVSDEKAIRVKAAKDAELLLFDLP